MDAAKLGVATTTLAPADVTFTKLILDKILPANAQTNTQAETLTVTKIEAVDASTFTNDTKTVAFNVTTMAHTADGRDIERVVPINIDFKQSINEFTLASIVDASLEVASSYVGGTIQTLTADKLTTPSLSSGTAATVDFISATATH